MAYEGYFAAHSPSIEERLRLRGLEMLWDYVTRRRLLEAGLAGGQRCLEVGAGGGSVTRMMADIAETRVVAVDMDPRFLDPGDARYDIRQIDITSDDALEGEQFDVIHCRFLLMHLPDPAGVLRMFRRHLAPGGFVLIEEPDMRTWAAADPAAPGAGLLDRVIQSALGAAERAGVWRNALGPRLRPMLQEAGFLCSGCEGVCVVAPDEFEEVIAVTTQTLRLAAVSALRSGDLGQQDLDAAVGVMRARRAGVVAPTLFGAVGQLRP